ncbi:MAG: TolC family protein [Bacteroidetes bacterium]|nr:TolC family protein [Bacteroidota bacterium]
MNRANLIRNSFCLIWFTFATFNLGVAQSTGQFDLLKDDIQSKIPPLSVLIDSALAYDPYVAFRNKQILINSCKLYSDRKQWMRDIGFQADVRYGTFDNFSTNTAEGQTPSNFSTARTETKYGLGAYIKFPLFDIINYKNQINLAKTEIKQAQDMFQLQSAELRQKVIKQYNDLVLKQKILQIKAKYLETSKINMLMTEKEFINGVISVSEYTRLSSITSQSEENFESAKMDFKTAYMILEEIVGFKLNVTFDIP